MVLLTWLAAQIQILRVRSSICLGPQHGLDSGTPYLAFHRGVDVISQLKVGRYNVNSIRSENA